MSEMKIPMLDGKKALEMLPKRPVNGNKGTFGRALLICGSERYPGAAHLSAEACLRGGAGYVMFSGDNGLPAELRMRFPELLFIDREPEQILKNSTMATATLCGPGLGKSKWLGRLVQDLLALKTASPLVLDADAINMLAGKAECLREANRPVVITPHPLEFARLTGLDVEAVESNRAPLAADFAAEYHITLILKGNGTVITDGKQTFINPTGSNALAKAGSGDVLAGFLTSLLAQGETSFDSACSAVYIHGLAGEKLAERYSAYGVTPSDLPIAMAKCLAEIL